MSDTPSQKSVIRSLNAGTASAPAKLDRMYRDELCRMVEREMDRRVRARQDPEDVVQSALMSVFRQAAEPDFQIDCAGQLWNLLATVARHKMLKSVAKIKAGKRTPMKEDSGAPDRSPARAPGPEDVVTAIDLMDETLKGLDAAHVEVFRLRLKGRPQRDIAKRVGCCRETVETILDRLQARLKRLLERAEH